MTQYLDRINHPDDLKNIAQAELPHVAAEIRAAILKKLDATGGHLGSNLGIVEATIALHYVFDSPRDRIVWDVSHQCYPHKILTGRKDGFLDPAKYNDYSGYTAPAESEHDSFFVGHTSTSVSLALGLATARDLKGGNEKIIAVIGDGSLTGGEAFEGLNNAAMLDGQFLIVVNDNEMSIAPNHGGVYRNLAELRASKGKAVNNFFKTVGLDYLYVEAGNDIDALIAAFAQAKNAVRPLVVHIHTFKGKGDAWAETNQEAGHWRLPAAAAAPAPATENYNTITADYLLAKIAADPTVMVINPATPGAVGLREDFRNQAGKQFIDVGIAEEHAVALASGLAKNGAKPVLAILGTFLQRTYDQLMQDLCLNSNPATILIYWGGISGASATHSGAFDMSMTGNIPNLVGLAPVTKEEYLAMLDWSIDQTAHPVAIRLPREVIATGETVTFDESTLGKFAITRRGQKVAILGLGNFYCLGQKVKALLAEKFEIDATLINPRIYSQLDQELLTDLKLDHELIVTLEDGILSGGFGEKVARFYGASNVKVLSFGGEREFTDRVPLDELYRKYHLTPELIAEDIIAALQN